MTERITLKAIKNDYDLDTHEALRWAVTQGYTLCKHADPEEDGREDLSLEEAALIAEEDQGLIYFAR